MGTRILRDPIIVTDALKASFYANTIACPNGCIEWLGKPNRNGYGHSSILGRVFNTHVIAWRLANEGRPVPLGMVVMHECDNPKCVNPCHLAIGTQSENMQHAARIGVLAASRERGEQRYNAVFTADKVYEARRLYASGVPIFRIAQALEVSRFATAEVVKRRTWRHLLPQENQ